MGVGEFEKQVKFENTKKSRLNAAQRFDPGSQSE